MDAPDETLVAAYLGGDERAFTTLVERHLRGVYSFARRFAGEDADDIAQETFTKAWRHLSRFDPAQASFKTWLMRIARNTAVDALRKKRPHAFSALANESTVDAIADTGTLPDEAFAAAADEEAVHAALAKLPLPYRDVLVLHYLNHLSFEEIGTALGEPASTIRSRHRRALAQMRSALQRNAP